ncbi:uncharacterized protein E0L32_011093 [Thyridium curvatum]|uniref:N-acetyltransferase domain-containing protein n=1 Tax=Thyridium curvatum TaxID=1093900 RepID=A0A507AQ20_9PEZI|nr:uncharacterized protein E0L32_011093 [Thyridium curvatum]TPX06948.1 hypothetical protein E0L32_011093 [Thyridium curvatum]
MSSNVNTPLLEPTTSQTMEQPAPAALASGSSSDSHPPPLPNMDDIPPLSLEVLTDRNDKVDALRLVADSVAQQRQQASRDLVTHPLCLAALTAVAAAAHQLVWVARAHRDVGVGLALLSGLLMTYLLAIRYVTAPYLKRAEDMKYAWLVSDDAPGAEDVVIGTRYGGEIIGACVLRLEPNLAGLPGSGSGGSGTKRRTRGGGGGGSASLKGGRGVIRAWTTRLRYRGRGVGADMLHEAVRVTRERCGRDAEVGFAREHANSEMVLPEMFNGSFRRRERRAARALENVLAEMEGSKKRK